MNAAVILFHGVVDDGPFSRKTSCDKDPSSSESAFAENDQQNTRCQRDLITHSNHSHLSAQNHVDSREDLSQPARRELAGPPGQKVPVDCDEL